MATDKELLKLAEKYERNLPVFCADLLKIKPEAGGIVPFYLNNTQRKFDAMLNRQLSQTGKVRALVLKPRREGMSTYIGARFYHKTIFTEGWQTYILTHKHKATNTLFEMVKLFHREMLDEFRVSTSKNNDQKLMFDIINSGYALGTAGSKNDGRSELAHCFHGSEVAFWDNADEVASGALNIVGDLPNTEIILESTGLPNTYFQETWEKAVAGQGEFMPCFFPWYLSERNVADARGLILTPEEAKLMTLYKGMTVENIAFMRNKKGMMSDATFRREYPAVPADAFSADGTLSYIPPDTVTLAVERNNLLKSHQPRLLGCDPSSSSKGDTVGMVVRVDDKVIKLAEFNREVVLDRAMVVLEYIRANNIDHTFIDAGGSGKEMYELILSWGLPRKNITLVYFGSSATDKLKFRNKRNEMYNRMRSWLENIGDIPKSLQFEQELAMTKEVVNSEGEYVLESKKNMRKSPNLADGLALTFAHPVRPKETAGVGSYASN